MSEQSGAPMPHPRVQEVNQIMSMVTEVASAWSLVGGVFDDGSAMDNHTEAQMRLRGAVENALRSDTVTSGQDLADVITLLFQWHKLKMGQLDLISANAVEGKTMDFGGELIVLTDQTAAGLRTGLILAKHFLGKLPITLSPGPDPDSAED